jgi:hypothetical protein
MEEKQVSPVNGRDKKNALILYHAISLTHNSYRPVLLVFLPFLFVLLASWLDALTGFYVLLGLLSSGSSCTASRLAMFGMFLHFLPLQLLLLVLLFAGLGLAMERHEH